VPHSVRVLPSSVLTMSALKRLCCSFPETMEGPLPADHLEQAILTGCTNSKQTQALKRQLAAYAQPTVVPREGSASYLVNIHRRSSLGSPDPLSSNSTGLSASPSFVRLSSMRSNLLTSDVLAGKCNL
jgi:hypothetical protein